MLEQKLKVSDYMKMNFGTFPRVGFEFSRFIENLWWYLYGFGGWNVGPIN